MFQPNVKRRPCRPGFTLVEMLVAVVLLGIGISACVACIGSATRASAAAEQYTAIQLMAREKLSEIGLNGAPEGENQGDFAPDRPGYAWQTTSRETDAAGLRDVQLTILWGNPENPKRTVFRTFVRQKAGS